MNYRDILKDEYTKRKERNTSYSLRAFAKSLGLSSTRMSDIFNEKQGLSYRAAKKVAQQLGYEIDETNYFCDLVESEHARSTMAREAAKERLKEVVKVRRELDVERFKDISNWYYFALIELIRNDNFKEDPQWIASKLTISTVEAKLAMEKLLKLNLIERKNKKLVATEEFVAVASQMGSQHIRKYHEQIIEKAKRAIHFQDVSERDLSAMNIMIPEDQLEEAKEDIKKFRRRFMKKYETTESKSRLYCLAQQFFALDKKDEEKL